MPPFTAFAISSSVFASSGKVARKSRTVSHGSMLEVVCSTQP